MTERKIALITGGSRGIGLACALELAKAGCDIIINDICEAEKAQPALDEIKACGVNAYFYRFDVSNDEEVQANVDKMIAEHGRIDVILRNSCCYQTHDESTSGFNYQYVERCRLARKPRSGKLFSF